MQRLLSIVIISLAMITACSDDDDNLVGTGGSSGSTPLFAVHVVDTLGQPVGGLRVGSINHSQHLHRSPPTQAMSMPGTTIDFNLPYNNSLVTLEIQNYFKNRVRLLLDREALSAGIHSVPWDNENDQGRKIRSGFYYFYILLTDSANTVLLEDEKAVVLDYGSNALATIIGTTDSLGIFATDSILLFPCLLPDPPIIYEADEYGNIIGEIDDFYSDTVSITLSDPADSTKFMYFKRGLDSTSNSFNLIWNPNKAL